MSSKSTDKGAVGGGLCSGGTSQDCKVSLTILQVQQFSSKSTDTSLRVASLEYLGIVAARLRKDAVSSHLNQEVIDDIVHKVIKFVCDVIEDSHD